MDEVEGCEAWRLDLDGLKSNKVRATVLANGTYAVKQSYFGATGRWYVYLPKHSGLVERFGGRSRIFRSHLVWMIEHGATQIPVGHVINRRFEKTKDSYAIR